MNPTDDKQQLDNDVAEWTQLKEWMAKAKEREMHLRQLIAARLFSAVKLPTGAYPEGTTNIASQGYAGKLQSQWKREVLEELLVPTLTEAQLTPAQQKDLIQMNPKLSVKAYRQLPPEKQRIIDKMISIEQGTIQLEVVKLPK